MLKLVNKIKFFFTSGRFTVVVSYDIKRTFDNRLDHILKRCRRRALSVIKNGIISIRYSLPQFFTVLSAELYAIHLAVEDFTNESCDTSSIICSDS